MKKLNLNKLFSLVLLLTVPLFSVSCIGDQEDNDGYSTLVVSSPTGSVEFASPVPASLVEADVEFPFTVTLSTPQSVDIAVNVFQAGGTATEGEDFDLSSHKLIIPAFTTQVSGSLKIYADTEAESDETIVIQIGDEKSANVNFTPVQVSLTLENYVADELDITFEWAIGIPLFGNVYSTSNNVDLDIFVADAKNYDNNDPWATINWTDYAATGNHPEHLVMDMATWGDGEYILFHDLWNNNFYGYGTNTQVPITATFVRAGAFTQVIVQDDSQAINTDTAGYEQGGAHNGFIAKVKIDSGVITIYDYSGAEIVSGKQSTIKTKRPSFLLK